MNFLRRLVVSSTLLLAISQPSLAVMVSGQIRPSPASASTTSIVERGGTVNAIDLEKKTIVVDGVSYAFAATTVKIHSPSGKTRDKAAALKAGMQIRFSTFRDPFSGQDQVREIWVTSAGGHSPRQ